MPMVPETFGPSVALSETPMTPATGPWVSPMKNRAPGLLQQTGDTLARAGAEASAIGNTIGDRVEDTMNTALTKSAETSFLKSAQDLLYDPAKGYLNTRGLNAQTEWTPATQAIAKARQDARATLTNPIQQHAYDLATNDHMLALGRTMSDHQHTQVTQYGIQQSQDRADSMNLLAKTAYTSGRMDDYAKYAAQADAETLHVASLNGAAPDSDVAQSMRRAKHADLVHGITTSLLDDHKYDQAKQFFESEQPNIDMKTAELLGNAVKAEYDRNLTETKGDGFLAAAARPADSFMATPNPKGLVERGNLSIWNRPTIDNADGTHSSEYSVSFEQNGREVLVPTVVNGKFLTPDGKKPEEGSAAEKTMFKAAWDHYLQTGEHLGKFASAADADAYADQLHNRGTAPTGRAAVPYTYGPLASGSTINPMKITDVPGSPRPGGRVHDGYDIAMPVGTQVAAPLDGKVVKVWNDEQYGGGLSMRVQLADGNTLGVAHLSAANLKEGDTVNRGQVIGLSGKTGNATGPVLHVALADPDGKKIDYFAAGQAQPDQTSIADPNVLQRAMDMVNADQSTDPYQKKQIIKYMETQHSHQRSIQAQEYQDVKQQAVDYYYSHNESIDGMPAALKTQLKPEDVFNLSQPASVETDPETMANFILDPKSVTVDNVKNAYAGKKLNNGAYFSLLRDAMDQSQNPSKVMEATVEADRLKYIADQAGIPNIYTSQTPAQKRDYAGLLVRVQEEVDAAQQQKGGKLSQSEKDAIIQRNVQQHVITHLRSAWNPMAWMFGEKTYTTGMRQFQVPRGATSTVMSRKDGKLHFTDGKNDLGVVPEGESVAGWKCGRGS
jgi:murein DD-endopeptidase MepM/ murein hydrolase activator NlpD